MFSDRSFGSRPDMPLTVASVALVLEMLSSTRLWRLFTMRTREASVASCTPVMSSTFSRLQKEEEEEEECIRMRPEFVD